MLSFWEKRSFINYEFIVVGGGIVGLSTAASIKEKKPKSSVLVLERGIFPSGASTKNAGFACFGSLTELVEDLQVMGEDAMLNLVEKRLKGLLKLRKRLGDDNIAYEDLGGYELLRADDMEALSHLEGINCSLFSIFKETVFSENKQKLKTFQFNKSQVSSLVENNHEGQIDTGKMMKSLIAYVKSLGIDILTGAEVLTIEDQPNGVDVYVKNLEGQEAITFRGNYTALCTNAFTRQLIPQLEIAPGRGQVLVTAPIPDLPFRGVFHYDKGYYYFRNFGNQVIFGGGRNMDIEGETTTIFDTTAEILANLKSHLTEIILPGKSFAIESQWAGIMAFGPNKMPLLKKVSPRIFAGVRLGGMGVAIGSLMGNDICDLILAN